MVDSWQSDDHGVSHAVDSWTLRPVLSNGLLLYMDLRIDYETVGLQEGSQTRMTSSARIQGTAEQRLCILV